MGVVVKLGSSIWFDGFKAASKSIKNQLRTSPAEEIKHYGRIWESLYQLFVYDKEEYLEKFRCWFQIFKMELTQPY